MSFYEGIFDPQFKISKLKAKYYLIPLEEISTIKSKLDKTLNHSPRLMKNKKLLNVLWSENKPQELEVTYNLHKRQHPECPLLPKIRLEIQKHKRKVLNETPPPIKFRYSRPLISVTPNPRLKFSDSISGNSLKLEGCIKKGSN